MRIMFVSLGCDKNLVDTEHMLGELKENGYTFTDKEEEAELVIINTCCFIKDAKEESIQTILEMAERKKNGNLKRILVTGCLAQRYQEEVQKEIPEVDGLIGISDIGDIVEAVKETERGEHRNRISDCNASPYCGGKRVLTGDGVTAYLKIAEGCDKHCTYCIIPKIRGKYRSIPMDNLLKEAKELAEQGIKELILVAQETTVYGVDLYKEKKLPELLHMLCKIEGIEWIRILYCYPEEITTELVQTIKNEPKICHYLDMPIQHASTEILKKMARRTDEEELREKIAYLRKEIPDICLRTTLISGFPGETKEDHVLLYQFVNEMEFDRLGVFTYSPEEGTVAAVMPGQLPEKVKEERRQELMELQQAIAFEKTEKMIGKEVKVLVEGYLPEEEVYVGRTYMDAPGIDGLIFFMADRELISGAIVPVLVTGCKDYDLIGEIKNEFAK